MKAWDRLKNWQQAGVIGISIVAIGWGAHAEYNSIKVGIETNKTVIETNETVTTAITTKNTKDIHIAAASIKAVYAEIQFGQNKRRLEQLQDKYGRPHCPDADKVVQKVCADLEHALFKWLSRKVK